jgi:formamidopyrimidine-DNA glycosylase
VPELPEVEYERRRLQRAMARGRIRAVIMRRANLRYDFPLISRSGSMVSRYAASVAARSIFWLS